MSFIDRTRSLSGENPSTCSSEKCIAYIGRTSSARQCFHLKYDVNSSIPCIFWRSKLIALNHQPQPEQSFDNQKTLRLVGPYLNIRRRGFFFLSLNTFATQFFSQNFGFFLRRYGALQFPHHPIRFCCPIGSSAIL